VTEADETLSLDSVIARSSDAMASACSFFIISIASVGDEELTVCPALI